MSEHFKYSEFVKTNHREYADKNWLEGEKFEDNIAYMARWLEAIRKVWGKPIVINSGYRSPAVNKAIGGVATSNHLTGCAADIKVSGIEQLIRYATILLDISDESQENFDELLMERSPKGSYWLHFAVRPKNNRRKTMFMQA